ncbi:MAG TPA: hypothetical protein VLI05_04310 [Candidatus Saccharimonadia bacterium]|nr:hypothetical protein [Candidatus Saccharimonadia bacterium]
MSRWVDQLSPKIVFKGCVISIMTGVTGPYVFRVESVDGAHNQLIGRITVPQQETDGSTRGSIRADLKRGDKLEFTADPELEASLRPNGTASWITLGTIVSIRLGL